MTGVIVKDLIWLAKIVETPILTEVIDTLFWLQNAIDLARAVCIIGIVHFVVAVLLVDEAQFRFFFAGHLPCAILIIVNATFVPVFHAVNRKD